MIQDNIITCSHGIEYDEQTQYCCFVGCKYERRLRNESCPNCQIHQHEDQNSYILRQIYQRFSAFVYESICHLEFHILNDQTNVNFLKEQIEYGQSLIDNLQYIEEMSECLLFKIHQISQLLLHQNILQNQFNEFIRFNKYLQGNKKQLNLMENTQKYLITKAFNISKLQQLNCLALSPNEKYLLLGYLGYVYIYDIKTKLNIKIYRFEDDIYLGQFSNNSSQIILTQSKGIIILDIQTSRKINIKYKTQEITHIHVDHNSIYLIQFTKSYHETFQRLIRFNLKGNRFVFSYTLNVKQPIILIYIFKHLITFQSIQNFFMINQTTRQTQLQKINLQQYKIKKIIVIKTDEILSLQRDSSIIIWNVDYQNNSLTKKSFIPLSGTDILAGNTLNGFFYVIMNNQMQIVDRNNNYDCIYSGQFLDKINLVIKRNTTQFNTQKIFIVFSQDWISVLERHYIE